MKTNWEDFFFLKKKPNANKSGTGGGGGVIEGHYAGLYAQGVSMTHVGLVIKH